MTSTLMAREDRWKQVVDKDIAVLKEKNDADTGYDDSWKRRGGVGAFMMAARKWDRLEVAARRCGWDIFEAITRDHRPENVLDDIGDLRRYLILIEEHIRTNIETEE